MKIDFELCKSERQGIDEPHFINIDFASRVTLDDLEDLETELLDIIFKIKDYRNKHQ